MADKNTKVDATTRKGRESYTFVKQQARRNRRSEDAHARKLEHDSLTVTEKVAKAKSRRGNSVNEITRLTTVKKTVVTSPVVVPAVVTETVKAKKPVKPVKKPVTPVKKD